MSRQVGAKRQQYSLQVLEEAAKLVREKSISLNKAAKKYAVPKTTLQNAVHYKYGGHKIGHKTVLNEGEEKRIVDWAIHMARIGYGRTRQELATTVKKILDEDGRSTPFRDNRPGREWLNQFFNRHPELSVRTSIQLGKERAIISAEKITKWFDNFRTYIENEVGDKDLLKDPSRIYNADETGVSLCLKGSRVIGMKGAPVVYHYGNSDKSQITVMAACSATGHYVPPMLIFPGQRFSYNPLEGFESAALGRSDSGWMDAEVFCNWLQNVFIPSVNERKVKKPVLLLIDGHVTHVTMEASNICLENGIELFCLLEHASHVLQPLDLRLFSSLKKSWRQAVRDWQTEHVGDYVTKQNFSRIFRTAWEQSTTIEAAVKGFQESGLFPFDPSKVAQSVKLEPSKIFTQETQTRAESEESSQTNSNGNQETKEQEEGANPMTPTNQTDEMEVQCENHTEVKETDSQHDVVDQQQSTGSPFSKYLRIPAPTLTTKSKAVRKMVIPKAITGTEYRKLMEEKRKKKEEEEKEKEQRKQAREQKRKLREEEKSKKKAEAEAKRQKRAEEKQRKRDLREKLLKALENSSDSEADESVVVDQKNCYTCEQPYDTDFIECTRCFRRFHIECVDDDYLSIEGLPYECKYC